jgi:hypothetical protein
MNPKSQELLSTFKDLYSNPFDKKYKLDAESFLGEVCHHLYLTFQGCSSVVKTCTEVISGRKFAVKIVRNDDPEILSTAQKEFDLVKSVSHPNLV